ncbi:hypothetical protein DACRYDRAFT_20240 [Dacryopinax primogenitus]|uniref:Uncharacterized protein n=1 Tax=Dacryopinax primogenitus (strain DJM 731) TaxID=1858805 RepID=M5GGQ9_DACPD|nr:uncharacterized protein DACRYDRAFT_20240 [Dacryopinax primogenitus]EJU05918.1 hypothetical protein DACRYDRAFT_20240 [Dacryopinax primogenitus]
MVNITLDDTSPFISYSDGWGVQSPQDPNLEYYLQETYHGTQTIGSNATIVFSGSGVYLYGSMGPAHGNFEVSVNGARQTFSGYSSTPLFQQCLFSSMLDASYNEIILINIGGSGGSFMDLDYIITTVPENTTFPAPPSLAPITPSGGFPSASPTSTSSSTGGSSLSTASSSSTSTTVTTVLTIVFAILTVVLLSIIAFLYMRHRRRKQVEQEHLFRYGRGPAVSPSPQPDLMTNLHWTSQAHTQGPAGGGSPNMGYPPRQSPVTSSLGASYQLQAGRSKGKNPPSTFLPGFDA